MPLQSPLALEDPDAFFRRECEGLCQYVRRILRGTDGAVDVVQESFLRFYEICSNPAASGGRPLLFRIARNLAIDRLRELRKESQLTGEMIEIPVALTPEDLVLRKERAHLLRAVLAVLTDRDRELLALRQACLSYVEIGEVMNLNPHSVGQFLARAVRRFREKYVEMGQAQDGDWRSAQRRRADGLPGRSTPA